MNNKIILASSSIYRARLLSRLALRFEIEKPSFDEESLQSSNLSQNQLAQKLSYEKGKSVHLKYPQAVVISADQVCHQDSEIFHKPGSEEQAALQLLKLSGKTHELVTSYSIFSENNVIENTITTQLTMRALSKDDIHQYIIKDKPIDCAGSYKYEEHGITLFESIKTSDETAIIGIPLLHLQRDLISIGLSPWKN